MITKYKKGIAWLLGLVALCAVAAIAYFIWNISSEPRLPFRQPPNWNAFREETRQKYGEAIASMECKVKFSRNYCEINFYIETTEPVQEKIAQDLGDYINASGMVDWILGRVPLKLRQGHPVFSSPNNRLSVYFRVRTEQETSYYYDDCQLGKYSDGEAAEFHGYPLNAQTGERIWKYLFGSVDNATN